MDEIYDIAIVGGGPAGLSAALTGSIRKKKLVLFEQGQHSYRLRKAHTVDNYLGLPNISGQDMMDQFVKHVTDHGVALKQEKVVNVFPTGETFMILTNKETYQAKSVILATGVVPTGLFTGEKELLGRGVSYCATCDGMLYRGKDVAVISYTKEGEHESNYLADLCQTVTYLPQYRGEYESVNEKVTILQAKPQAIVGQQKAEYLETDKESLKTDGVFILRQSDPVENILSGLELDGEVIKVNRDMTTNVPGVFAAGDATGRPWQIAKAAGEGLTAVLSAITYLDNSASKA